MNTDRDHQVIALFGGEAIAPGYRGRRSGARMDSKASRRIAIGFAALVISFTTAATAITARRQVAAEPHISAGANLIAGPGLAGFESAIY
jgi:hypothetical protein